MKNTGRTDNFSASLNLFSISGFNPSRSQHGEDMIILGLLQSKKDRDWCGFYVDVGMNSPTAYSNTAMLNRYYGWQGININSNADVIRDYSVSRDTDVNICTHVGYAKPTAGSTSAHHPQRLDQILHDALPKGRQINLLTIAIEGPELGILKSNNWEVYHPDILVVDYHCSPTTRLPDNPLNSFVFAQGYQLVSQCVSTSIFVSQN